MKVGDLFDGRYIIEREIGHGGMGAVYLARNINTDTCWAVKEVCRDRDGRIDLAAEAKLLRKLDHPALPRLFDMLEQDGKLYIVSEYIDGVPLDRKLEEEGRIAEEIVVEWAMQLCGALNYLHTLKPNPVIYRDMKPSNIILTSGGKLKLVDFGIAREYKPGSGSDTVYIGTRGYAAPEQYGSGQSSPASDIYGLGATMHQLLTGENPASNPFGLKPARYYNSAVSAELESIIMKCTAIEAAERYQSAAELMRDLGALCDRRRTLPRDPESGKGKTAGIRMEQEPGVHVRSFRNLVITVWDNAEFGCEFAYAAAKLAGCEVLLADLDLLAPKADLYLNIKRLKPGRPGIFGQSGLGTVMDAIGRGSLTSELLRQSAASRKDLGNLHVLTGSARLEYYEYYGENSVTRLVEKCCRNYDLTVLLVNRSIYDAFTLESLILSDLNIVATKGDLDQLREFNTYIAFLREKQDITPEKTKFVLFEHDTGTGMSLEEIREATRNNLLGRISASRKRAVYRNMVSSYVSHMEKNICNEYAKILAELGMLQPAAKSGTRHVFVQGKKIFLPARHDGASVARQRKNKEG